MILVFASFPRCLLSGAVLFVTFFLFSILYPRKAAAAPPRGPAAGSLQPAQGLRLPCSGGAPARMDASPDRSPRDARRRPLQLGLGHHAYYARGEPPPAAVPDSGRAQCKGHEGAAARRSTPSMHAISVTV